MKQCPAPFATPSEPRLSTRRVLLSVFLLGAPLMAPLAAQQSVARQWNEALMDAIRGDLARPTVHARNLFHVSAAMYDAWAAYDERADTYLHHEKLTATDLDADRREAISYAAYRLLVWRFRDSVSAQDTRQSLDNLLETLGYDSGATSTEGNSPRALGNRIAETYIEFGLSDGANESGAYGNEVYEPVNPPLFPVLPGTSGLEDPNRWQPLTLDLFIDQSGNPFPGSTPQFLSPEWGQVAPFALSEDDLTVYERDGFDYLVYHDPGPPPLVGTITQAAYMSGFEQVLEWSSLLDPSDGGMIDISPAALGNNTLGTNDGDGYSQNPITDQPYASQIVPAGDYYRVLAEFWADGPDSETPPGHWFTIANYVSDHPAVAKRLGGTGPELDDLEWDVKVYLALGGAMHDAAVAAWGVKGWYDYIRPISAIRYLGENQRSDPMQPNYSPMGLELVAGRIEIVTDESIQPGGKHEMFSPLDVGKIAARAWRGPDYVLNPATDTAGVGWILVENWWPYQRPSFVTPPFAGYVSGHSTYSRAAAEVLTRLTGSRYFPGGLGEFEAPKNEFLVFEDGPSVDLTLQWASYQDAADECSLSRIYGGIHPTGDDIPGRFMGSEIGPDAFDLAVRYFEGHITGSGGDECIPSDTRMCLNQDRFQVEIAWQDSTGRTGQGRVVPIESDDSGLFWFFNEHNWEMLIKVLDGCRVNNNFWVFASATTDVAYSLIVTDSENGAVRTYSNQLGHPASPILDTSAFETCSP